MVKRVFAWALLIGFVLLLLNIMVFHFYLIPSIAIYLVIAIWFIFNNKPIQSTKVQKTNDKNNEGEG